jgi:hypothetical protein
MQRAILFFAIGSIASFLLNYFLSDSQSLATDIYYACAFGLGWGMAYFLDRPDYTLPKKLGLSFIGIAILVVIGFIFFNFETAIPSIIRFSTVFVAYYLIASFRESKSLRY